MKQETRGRKKNETKGLEVKETVGIYLYPKQIKRIEKRFKTVGKFIEHCITTNNI